MEKTRQQRRAEERTKHKRDAADVKGKAAAVKRVAFIQARREEHKLPAWERVKLGFQVFIQITVEPFIWLRNLLFRKESHRRSRRRK